MPLRAISDARVVLRVTVGLTAAYVFAIAIFVYTGEGDPSFDVGALCFFEGVFSTPLMIATGLAIWLDSVQARHVFLGFAAGYIIFTSVVFTRRSQVSTKRNTNCCYSKYQ